MPDAPDVVKCPKLRRHNPTDPTARRIPLATLQCLKLKRIQTEVVNGR